eukprot:5077189-Amphidinium_carterae.4
MNIEAPLMSPVSFSSLVCVLWFGSRLVLNLQTYSDEAACRMFHKPLAKADPSWDIDAALIKAFSSGDAGGLIKQKWLNTVIAASGIDDAIKDSKAMMAREAFKYSLPSVKGEVKSAHVYLEKLKKQECIVESPKLTAWCTRVLKHLEHRYLVESLAKDVQVAVAKDPDFDTDGQGKIVLDKILEKLRAAGGAKELKDLLPLSMWRHLLSNDARAELIEWREALLKKSKKAMAAAAAPAKKEDKKKTKKTSASQDDIETAALALFRK